MNAKFFQNQAPFFEELLRYAAEPLKAFHTPGHKGGRGWEKEWLEPELLGKLDLTEISSLNWVDSLKAAEELAAEFYQADQSFFLVQGASQGIIASLLGGFSPGDTVLVARNCHSSVYHALILADLSPVYIEVEYLPGWEIPIGLKIDSLKQKLMEYPQSRGLIITNPTYQGIANLISIYRELIGERLLIIDEAHGGYLSWTGLSGFDAYEVADIWVQGTHKIFGSLTQTGMLHLRRGRIDCQRVRSNLDLIATTSPSFVLLASLDSNRRFLATEGKALFSQKKFQVENLKTNLKNSLLPVLSDDSFPDGTQRVDPWKLTISTRKIGLTGFEVERILQNQFGIQPEYAGLHQVTFFIAPWQDDQDLIHLEQGLTLLAKEKRTVESTFYLKPEIPPLIMKPREAFLKQYREVPLKSGVNLVSAAIIAAYPPGIPIIGPGELIRGTEVDLINKIIGNGGMVRGLSSTGTIKIVVGDQ